MANIYFARQGENLESILGKSGDEKPSLEERIAAIETMNPHLNGKPVIGSSYTPILITEPGDNEKMCMADFGVARREYRKLSSDTKQSLEAIGHREAMTFLESAREFANDYALKDGIGDINTFGGGAIGAVAAQGTGLLVEMQEVEAVLKEYGDAKGTEKAKLRPKVKLAYQRLHAKFGPVIEKYISRAGMGLKQNAIYNINRGMAMVNKGRIAPLTSGRKMQFFYNCADKLHVVSKGVFFLDIGLRVNNVRLADNRMRAGILEGIGWGLATTTAYVAGGIAVSLALGPIGWIIAIVLIGALAVGADYLGKYIGASMYDNISTYNRDFTTLGFR